MARSLDELIKYLLDEIALCGEQGATIADVLRYLDTFYGRETKATPATATDEALDAFAPATTVDRALQEKVWKWLTRHPDVYVGKDKAGNKLTLVEAEALSLLRKVYKTGKDVERSTLDVTPARQTGHSLTLHDDATGGQEFHPGNTNDSLDPPEQIGQTIVPVEGSTINEDSTAEGGDNHVSTPASILRNGEKPLSPRSQTKGSKPLRVYVSENRMWYAAAGHAPNLAKVPRLDFVLLSIIAAQREKGILQTDLTRISGQDKRSTPKRTQLLHEKGYIEKKKVQVRGQATSLCTLRKFISPQCKASDPNGSAPEEDLWKGNVVTRKGPTGEVVDIRALLRAIFDILKELNIITHIDLKRKLVPIRSLEKSWMVMLTNALLGDL
ncbi:MAG: hypothetical protein M1830_004335 [Pleopsidium flavum]|nr:MAG: hypothetical protein M1830_004335 [Pleopsidium flavum]